MKNYEVMGLTKGKKNLLFIVLIALVAISIIAYKYRSGIRRVFQKPLSGIRKKQRPASEICKDCYRYFSDGPSRHERAYHLKKGVEPQKDENGVKKLANSGAIVEIEDNELYEVKGLTHSYPYQMPEGKKFLGELALGYRNNCEKAGIGFIPFQVSSLLRTEESVKALMKRNGNAIAHSPHLKGRTFDIDIAGFSDYPDQMEKLISTLHEFHKKNKCYVIFEKSQGCLHITAR
jgi:hypothetical protein